MAYSPWLNGTVEKRNRDIQTAMRSLPGELKLAPKNRVCIIEVIPTIINESPKERPGRNAVCTTWTSLEVMTVMKPRHTLVYVMED